MMLPQHLLSLILTAEDITIIADNARRPVISATEAYRTQNTVSKPLPTVSKDTLPVLPRCRSNSNEFRTEKMDAPSIHPPLMVKTNMASPSSSNVKSLPIAFKMNAPGLKSVSRWDSSPGQQQTLSGLAKQKYHNFAIEGPTRTPSINAVDKSNHSSLPLLPRRRDSAGLTAAMIGKVLLELDELDLIDCEDEDVNMEETNTQSPHQLVDPSC
jgi:hypothetical protein